MNPAAGDNELVRTYAREGSETAFRILVSRHVNLVFGAALRQVGDSGMAEEITQNVFVALARKAPRLAGHETLAGWLHRTAILEAKAHIRAQLRRQRREFISADLAALAQPGPTPPEDLVLLLDEGLLNLRDPDRLVLVLRFLEGRSLREVGLLLGVDEDAARKRVSRALGRLSEFFRVRGYAVPIGSGAALLSQAVRAAPGGLAATASQAGLATGGAAGGFKLILIQLMTLTKTHTALACSLLVALPLAWQAQTYQRETAVDLLAQLKVLEKENAEAEAEARRWQNSLIQARADAFNAQARFAALQSRRDSLPRTAHYRWDDRSPFARVSKEFLRQLPLSGVTNPQGQLSGVIKAALQLTTDEAEGVQASVDRLLANYHAAEATALRPVAPGPADFNEGPPEDVRVFEVTGLKESVRELREAFRRDLDSVLDAERAQIFAHSLKDWIQEEERGGIDTRMAIFSADHRLRIYRQSHQTDEPRLGWSRSGEFGSVISPISVDEVPSYLRLYLQDWIDTARADHARVTPPESKPATSP